MNCLCLCGSETMGLNESTKERVWLEDRSLIQELWVTKTERRRQWSVVLDATEGPAR